MKKLSLFMLATAGLIVAGCSSTKKDTLAVMECNFPDAPSSSAPLWVCGGVVEGVEISAVGSTPKSKASINFMQQQASANARVFLAQQIQADIQAKVKSFTETTGVAESETVDTALSVVSAQITNQSLKGTKPLKQITSPNGTLYVLVGFDKNLYDSVIKESLATSYQNDKAQWQKIMSDKAFQDLEKSIAAQ